MKERDKSNDMDVTECDNKLKCNDILVTKCDNNARRECRCIFLLLTLSNSLHWEPLSLRQKFENKDRSEGDKEIITSYTNDSL